MRAIEVLATVLTAWHAVNVRFRIYCGNSTYCRNDAMYDGCQSADSNSSEAVPPMGTRLLAAIASSVG